MSKDHWNNDFSNDHYVYGEQANIFIQSKSHQLPENATVGCFAEGEGRNAIYLAKQGHHVTAFDQSDVGLKKTSDLAYKNQVHVQTAELDVTKENIERNQFDAAIMVFGHVPKADQAFFFQSMIDSVKPGGYLIFEVYSEQQLEYGTGGPPAFDMLYNPHDILSWIENNKCLHFYYGEAERHEGTKHNGHCHIIQAVVQK